MTERQFTPEYIAYMQSDEAKALQALWKPAVGDWVYGSRYERRMHMVIESRTEHEVEVVTGVGCDGVQTPKTYRNHDGVLWLPTLFQLIRVIEGATDQWSIERYPSTVSDNLQVWIRGIGFSAVPGSDLLLAAAQLAVRAVEEK